MTIQWYLQGTTPTEIEATDILQFAGASFDDPITVSSFNDTIHVETSVGGNKSSGNSPRNNKFVSQTGGTGGDSQANWGDGVEDLDQITTAEAALRINITHTSAVALTGIKFYAYNGSNTATAPTGVTFHAAEVGDTNFTNAEGSAAALTLDNKSADDEHDLFLVVSASPESVGLKDAFSLRIEFTYS